MADDFSAILDVASVPDAPAPEPTTPEVPAEPTVTEAPPADGADATPDQPEAQAEGGEATPEPEPRVDGRTNPAQIRSALKAFRDSDPKNAPVARELNDGYGRYLAYKDAFGTVADARNAKAFLEANGGVEGLTSLHETIKSVNDTDTLLYNGDPRVLDSIIEDMKRENKLDAFSKLAGPYLDKLRGIDEKGYFNVLKPHFYQGMTDLGIGRVFTAMEKALSGDKPDLETARSWASELTRWFKEMEDGVKQSDKSKLDPDRQAFEKERTDFQTAKQKEFHDSVGSAADKYSVDALGGALKPYLRLPFFKNLSSNRPAMLSLAKEIKGTLFEELGADKSYQGQMDAFFAAKAPDKARISQYHNAKVDTMAQRIVKQVIETRYPDYSKRTAVMPRPGAAPVAKPGAPQAGKPEFVKSKPDGEQIDWEKDDQRLLFITGRAYLKNGKFVTWNPKYK